MEWSLWLGLENQDLIHFQLAILGANQKACQQVCAREKQNDAQGGVMC